METITVRCMIPILSKVEPDVENNTCPIGMIHMHGCHTPRPPEGGVALGPAPPGDGSGCDPLSFLAHLL